MTCGTCRGKGIMGCGQCKGEGRLLHGTYVEE
jgi:DnaJ-class molecular chaperone